MRDEFAGNYPKRIVVSNRSKPRLDKIEHIFKKLNTGKVEEMEFHLCPEYVDNDAVLKNIKP